MMGGVDSGGGGGGGTSEGEGATLGLNKIIH